MKKKVLLGLCVSTLALSATTVHAGKVIEQGYLETEDGSIPYTIQEHGTYIGEKPDYIKRKEFKAAEAGRIAKEKKAEAERIAKAKADEAARLAEDARLWLEKKGNPPEEYANNKAMYLEVSLFDGKSGTYRQLGHVPLSGHEVTLGKVVHQPYKQGGIWVNKNAGAKYNEWSAMINLEKSTDSEMYIEIDHNNESLVDARPGYESFGVQRVQTTRNKSSVIMSFDESVFIENKDGLNYIITLRK